MNALTVVMATRNSAAFVEDALRSVIAEASRHPALPISILVIDAGSSDGTQALVRRVPMVRLEAQQGEGLWAAWNQGISQVTTPWLAILDSDDRWELGCLAAHQQALHSQPSALVSIGRTRFVVDADPPPPGLRPELLQGSHHGPIPGATLFRREAFAAIGPFNPALATTSDIDWFLRLRQLPHSSATNDAVVLNKRVHGDNLSSAMLRAGAFQRDLLQLARARIQKQRSHQAGLP